MLETILSAAGGGLFGLIGSGFTKFMGWKEKKLEYAFQIDMAKEERENMAKEIELAKTRGAIDLELQESEADAKGLQVAINAEASITGTSQWVADLRGSLRPILTYALSAGAFVLILTSPGNPWVNEFIFLATTAVTFWFGSRPISRK